MAKDYRVISSMSVHCWNFETIEIQCVSNYIEEFYKFYECISEYRAHFLRQINSKRKKKKKRSWIEQKYH